MGGFGVIALLEFLLSYYHLALQLLNHYTMMNSLFATLKYFSKNIHVFVTHEKIWWTKSILKSIFRYEISVQTHM